MRNRIRFDVLKQGSFSEVQKRALMLMFAGILGIGVAIIASGLLNKPASKLNLAIQDPAKIATMQYGLNMEIPSGFHRVGNGSAQLLFESDQDARKKIAYSIVKTNQSRNLDLKSYSRKVFSDVIKGEQIQWDTLKELGADDIMVIANSRDLSYIKLAFLTRDPQYSYLMIYGYPQELGNEPSVKEAVDLWVNFRRVVEFHLASPHS